MLFMLSMHSAEFALVCDLVIKLLQRDSMLSNMHQAELHKFTDPLILGRFQKAWLCDACLCQGFGIVAVSIELCLSCAVPDRSLDRPTQQPSQMHAREKHFSHYIIHDMVLSKSH